MQTAVETAAEKLEDGGSADVVLRDLADAASAEVSGSNGAKSTDESTQQAVRVDGLAEVRETCCSITNCTSGVLRWQFGLVWFVGLDAGVTCGKLD